MSTTKKIIIEIDNVTDAQAIALEDMFRTWVYLGAIGSSRWTSFFADGDGNFRPKITVDGKEADFAPKNLITDMMRKDMWQNNEYRIDFDDIAWRMREEGEK